MSNERKRSNFWYLAPVLFGLIGGILGYFGIRYDDPSKARNILIIGIVLAVLQFAIYIPIILLSEQFPTGFGGIKI